MEKRGTELRIGDLIKHQGGIYRITRLNHRTPGKGNAAVITKLQNIETGKNSDYRFRPDEAAEMVQVDHRQYQYLYDTDDAYVFMQPEEFDQVEIPKEVLGDTGKFLVAEMMVQIDFHEGRALNVILPKTVEAEIKMTEPNIKGATATSSYKPATLTNGVDVLVPPFIEIGEKIIINTEDFEYVERAK